MLFHLCPPWDEHNIAAKYGEHYQAEHEYCKQYTILHNLSDNDFCEQMFSGQT